MFYLITYNSDWNNNPLLTCLHSPLNACPAFSTTGGKNLCQAPLSILTNMEGWIVPIRQLPAVCGQCRDVALWDGKIRELWKESCLTEVQWLRGFPGGQEEHNCCILTQESATLAPLLRPRGLPGMLWRVQGVQLFLSSVQVVDEWGAKVLVLSFSFNTRSRAKRNLALDISDPIGAAVPTLYS